MRFIDHLADHLAILAVCLIALLLWPLQAEGEADCPITLPARSPVATAPQVAGYVNHAWYGSENLAAFIPASGNWRGMGPQYVYRGCHMNLA